VGSSHPTSCTDLRPWWGRKSLRQSFGFNHCRYSIAMRILQPRQEYGRSTIRCSSKPDSTLKCCRRSLASSVGNIRGISLNAI